LNDSKAISPQEISHFLDTVLFNIEKPGRYVGGEFNQVIKDWNSVKLKAALAFPDIYDIGFSNLGLNILYDQVNSQNDLLAERCFSVWEDMEQAMRKADIPLYTLESKHPVKDFDVVGISIPYETLYTNTLNLIDLAGIAVFSKKRTDIDPIIIAGGHATFNPAPMSLFIDVFVIGDGEDIFLEMLHRMSAFASREERLRSINDLSGIFIPTLFNVQRYFDIRKKQDEGNFAIVKHVSPRLPIPPQSPLIPNIDTTHNRIAIEVMRGCSHGCRFCQAGFITRPVRERPLEEIMASLRESIKQSGYDEISLLSLSISDYSNIQALIMQINQEFKGLHVNLSLPSLRIESFSEELMQSIDQRKGNFTLAPESATENMRRTINKPISDQDLLETAKLIFQKGWTSLKLYFLIGLPGENLVDVQHIIDLCKQVKTIGKRTVGGRARISVSINTFIPKCHTPLQWVAMDSIENVNEKHRMLREGFRNSGMLLSFPSMDSSLLEGWLSRGDESVAQVIYSAWKAGAKFDAWQDKLDLEIWKSAFAEHAIDPFMFSHRERTENEDLPWDFIDTGVSKQYLLREYERSKQNELTKDCRLNCQACGIQTTYDLVCRDLAGEDSYANL